MNPETHAGPNIPRPADRGFPFGGVLAALALVVAGILIIRVARSSGGEAPPSAPESSAAAALTNVTATAGRVTLGKDRKARLLAIGRDQHPELWYHVNLAHAPIGAKLALEAEWIDPAGRIVHRNRYTTSRIDREPWPTHVRLKIGADATTGTWAVRMLMGGRELQRSTFDVRSGNSGPEWAGAETGAGGGKP